MIKQFIPDYFTKEFIGFIICNGFAAIVNFTSRILISEVIPIYVISIIIAYCIGMVTAFILNKIFIFKNSEYSTKRQFLGYVIVNLVAIIQTVFFSILFCDVILPFINWTYYPDAIAHMIGIVIPVFTSFIGHKYISFGNEIK